MNKINKIYPMIHRDKLIYKYYDKIRIGTDDNDVVEINSSSEKLYELLKAMDGTKSLAELLKEYDSFSGSTVVSLIGKLIKTNSITILSRSWNHLSTGRFKSELTYYYSEGFRGQTVQEKLSNLRITIFGCGGGGSLLALQLANLGVKNINLVDNDKVSESNLNRQFIYQRKDIGKYKAEILQKRLLSSNPKLSITTSIKKIESVQDALREIPRQNWCFCCIDEPPYIAQRIINKAAYIKNIPSLYGFSARDSAKMMMVNPDETGCIDCLLTQRDNKNFEHLVQSFQKYSFSLTTPIIVPTMMLEVGWIMKKWLDVITSREKIKSVLYRFDYNTFEEQAFVNFNKKSNCPTCGKKENRSKLWKIIPIQ